MKKMPLKKPTLNAAIIFEHYLLFLSHIEASKQKSPFIFYIMNGLFQYEVLVQGALTDRRFKINSAYARPLPYSFCIHTRD